MDETPVINGVKMDDLALNSSRSRRRRDSQGSPKHQRRSINAENGVTDEFRRVSSAATTRELTKSQDREQMVNLRRKGKDNDRLGADKSENKRGSNIVLDVNSILDELVGDSGGGDGLSSKKSSQRGTERTPGRRNTPSPILKIESADPPQQPRKGNILETTVTRSSRLVRNNADESRGRDTGKSTTTTTVMSTGSSVSDKRPPIAPTKKMSSPGRLRGSTESYSARNSASSPVEEKSGRPPSRSPDMKEEAKDVVKQSAASPSRKVYSNGMSKIAQKEDDENELSSYYRSRTRSNAISKNESQFYSSKVTPKDDKIDEAEPPPSPRMREKSKRRSHIDSLVEMRPERSGSWNRMRQLVNSKALGMFYHNRRSQILDHDSLEEAANSDRGSSVERSDSSTSTPHSPTVLSPRSRESRSFSPNIQSPLMSKQPLGFDEAHKSALDKKEKEDSVSGTSSTPSSLVPPQAKQDDDEPQVHYYYDTCIIGAHYMIIVLVIFYFPLSHCGSYQWLYMREHISFFSVGLSLMSSIALF